MKPVGKLIMEPLEESLGFLAEFPLKRKELLKEFVANFAMQCLAKYVLERIPDGISKAIIGEIPEAVPVDILLKGRQIVVEMPDNSRWNSERFLMESLLDFGQNDRKSQIEFPIEPQNFEALVQAALQMSNVFDQDCYDQIFQS